MGERARGHGHRRRASLPPPVAAQDAAELPSPNCGTEPVELLAYFETGFPFQQALADEFTKQFPNVTWNIREDQFTNLMTQTPRLLSGDNPPDLVRLPDDGRPRPGRAAPEPRALRRGLSAGTSGRPPCSRRIASPRAADPGARVDLYAGGLNKAMTGVFYNKEQAAQIGMTEPPATLAEFEELLAAAKEAGLQPIMQWNTVNSGGGLAFPLQNLMAALGPVTAHQRVDLPEGGRDDRHAHQPGGRPASRAVDQGGLLPRGRQRHRVHRLERALRAGRGRLHVQR